MNSTKQAHLNSLRSNTAYPTYRAVIGIITLILTILAVLQGIGALVGGLTLMSQNRLGGFVALLIGLALAVLAFYLAKFWSEASLILADMGDSMIDANSRVPSAPMPPTATAYLSTEPNTPRIPVSDNR